MQRRVAYYHEAGILETEDVLQNALLRAKANKELGAIDAPTYHMIADKIDALKKLRFSSEYEAWRDKETYEWMKHKVAAQVGGQK